MDALVSKVLSFATHAHQEFAQDIWPKHPKVVHFQYDNQEIYPCYHNEHHIIGANRASSAVMVALSKTAHDPLQIQQSLTVWNQNEKTHFSVEDFEHVLLLAFATHDLGNLTKTDHLVNRNGDVQLEYADSFQLEVGPSEERSASLSMELIEHFDANNLFSTQMKKLLKYLILQTIFHPAKAGSDSPFWLLMQVIDQIGNAFFSDIPLHEANAGYLNELYVLTNIGERKPMSLKQFLLFQPQRLQTFFPDEKAREALLQIIDPKREKRNILNYFGELPDRPIEYETDIPEIYKGKLNS